MGLFRRPRYDRKAALEAAAREAGRGRRRRAIALYRQVLAAEPANLEIHRRLAPLLAADGQAFDAWVSFRIVASGCQRRKAFNDARNVWREAAEALPERIDAWLALARLERRTGRADAAFETLLEGRRRMARRRPEAIHLLREARALRPEDPEVAIDLARLLARTRRRAEACALLERVAEHSQGPVRRRVRRAQWRVAPSLANAWLWLRAA